MVLSFFILLVVPVFLPLPFLLSIFVLLVLHVLLVLVFSAL